MKVGQIIKVTPAGLAHFAPAMRQRLEGEIGLVVRQRYDLAYKLDQSKLPEHVKVYPAVVQFDVLKGFSLYEDGVMIFPDQAEVLS